MAGRPKSPYRVESDKGRQYGIVTTPLDRTRITMLGRWYCLSANHIARAETNPESLTNPHLNYTGPDTPTRDYASRLRGVKERFGKLVRVQENSGNHTGPLVGSALVDDGKVAWYATRYGMTAASAPWRIKSTINPQFAAHAWMAADVGLQLEQLGHRVLSEREMGTKTDEHGNQIDTNFDSEYVTSTGSQITKKPDVAVLAPNERNFIAVEVERDKDRPASVYVDKLKAYEGNANIVAVWYVCGSEVTARRVATAAERVFGERDFPLRIKVASGFDGWNGIDNLTAQPSLVGDLAALNSMNGN